ncbi:hypothetical protein ABMD26_003620 [Pseudomonas sp. PvP001]
MPALVPCEQFNLCQCLDAMLSFVGTLITRKSCVGRFESDTVDGSGGCFRFTCLIVLIRKNSCANTPGTDIILKAANCNI